MKVKAKRSFISQICGNVDHGQILTLHDSYAKHLVDHGLAEEISAPMPARGEKKPKGKAKNIWAIVASGPSLTDKDCEKLRDWRFAKTEEKRTVAVINTTFKVIPWADVLYACDCEWWDEYITKVQDIFWGKLWTQNEEAAKKYKINRMAGENKPGLGKNGLIHFGGNGGYQTINLAYNQGAEKIILLGFDMQRTDGKSHHHGDHPGRLNKNLPFRDWIRRFDDLAKDLKDEGIEVVNATRKTALKCFPTKNLEDILCGSK